MKKRGLILLIAIVLVLTGVYGVRLLERPDPNELVARSLERLNGVTSFRFTMTQHQWVDGKDRVLTEIKGEKDGGNTHIIGQTVGSEIEMIRIGDSLFMEDPFSKKWVRFSNAPAAQEVFLAELDPISSLQLKELGEVVISGQKKLNGEKVWECNLKPSVDNQLMEQFWGDFSYTLYIRKSDKTPVKAVIEAKSKAKGEPMSLTLEFKDIGKKINIQEPSL
ncbi:MAG: LolA-like protein [Desulfitobacteriaceae bacterium]